jgi:tetratricopeptide (TPR) repeat protein
MKIWSASSLSLILAGSAPGAAAEGRTEPVMACLAAVDLPCAEAALEPLLREHPDDPEVQAVAAYTAFHRGDYHQAVADLELAGSLADDGEAYDRMLASFQATRDATEGMLELRQGPVILRYAPGVDAILVDEAVTTMEAAQAVLLPQLGSLPPQPVLVEIYPTGKRFVDASGLGQEAVNTTGVVAISKWARLLMTSPRAVARGYTWKDTLVHEYVHQVVSHRSHDRTPVWLHEGIARYLESCWRGVVNAPLEPFAQSAMARALAEDDLVSFEEMHPSFAFLPSAERGALAYAQVQIIVATAVEHGGEGTIARCLDAIDAGVEAPEALADAAGFATFEELMELSVAAMGRLELVERKLAALPVALDGEGGDFAEDPLLAEHGELADHARLGDLLRQASRPRAALAEYGEAMPSDEPPSPLLAVRSAECHLMLQQGQQAYDLLRQSSLDYPAFAMTWKALGQIELERGDGEAALEAFRASADVNPFDPELQRQLASLLLQQGDGEAAARHARFERILLLGGEEIQP